MAAPLMSSLLRGAALAAILCLGAGIAPARAAGAALAQQSVLVISTQDLTSPYFHRLFVTFKGATKTEVGGGVTVYAETLDFEQFDSPDYKAKVNDWLRDKYQGKKVGVVVTVGFGALQHVLESTPRLFPEVPLVFLAITSTAIEKLTLPPNATGVVSAPLFENTVRMVRDALPQLKQLVLVGNSPERDSYRPVYANDLAAMANGLSFIDLRGKSHEQVLDAVARLPADAAIYFTSFTSDSRGRVFVSGDVLASLAKVANRPIFIDNVTSIGAGAVGGMAADPVLRGQQGARQVLQILDGTPASAIPRLRGDLKPVFDWRQLKRWDIDAARLPAGSTIEFHQPNLWERYRWQILATLVLVLLQSMLVAALLLERRRRTAAVSESRQRLAEIAHMNRNASATMYSAAVTHELNQPLAAILSNTEAGELILAQDPPDLDCIREILADIRRDDMRAAELIRRMRNLLKKSEPGTRRVDLNGVVHDVLKFLMPEARLRGIVIDVGLAPQEVAVAADMVQLQQVLINLVLNSMDAMAEMPPPRRTVSIRTALANDWAVLEVADLGNGFGAAIDRVFDSFYTTKANGMGLGLAITAAIVREHRGQIAASNVPGGGALVRIELPALAGARA